MIFFIGYFVGGLVTALVCWFVSALPRPVRGDASATEPAGAEQVPGVLRAGEPIRNGAELEIREGEAFEKPPLDIGAARLGNLVVWSGLLGAGSPWEGTAGDLRAALCAPGTRLNWHNQRELPAADGIQMRLQSMSRGRGRVTVESIGVRTDGDSDRPGQIWRLTHTPEARVE